MGLLKADSTLLTPEALAFVEKLHLKFGEARRRLLLAREARSGPKASLKASTLDAIKPEWSAPDWRTASLAPALTKRTVEITGPAEPKMMINALNSGADVFMADLEDALSPTWANVLSGHDALQSAIRGTLKFTSPDGRSYKMNEKTATLVVRPRGWHLPELRVAMKDGETLSASLFDFGLFFFHAAKEAVARGNGPYFYLPKLESAAEAQVWNSVFEWSENEIGIPPGSIRATVLIETLPAALQMEGILYELRKYIAALNAGRWDYLFSAIKCLPSYDDGSTVFPDRSDLTMLAPFMKKYAERLVAVCHARGAQAIGGMSAFVPSRKDLDFNTRAFAAVRSDKSREASQGFDGTWVAHPDLVPIARDAFSSTKAQAPAHSKFETQDDLFDLLPSPKDEPFVSKRPTLKGLDTNIDVTLRYLSAWLRGQGAVAIHGLMEDAATAEISRAQVWHWLNQKSALVLLDELGNQHTLTRLLVKDRIELANKKIKAELDAMQTGDLDSLITSLNQATDVLNELVFAPTLAPFLTLSAMKRLDSENLKNTIRPTGVDHVSSV